MLTAALLAVAFAPRKFVVAYVPNWVDLTTLSESIDYDKLTHINIAFENPADDEGNLSFNPLDDLLIKKAHDNKVKVLVSIGGGGASGDQDLIERYDRLMSDDNRAAFVAKITDYVVAHKLDGLDVDIEGPAIKDDYGLFVRALATSLRKKRKLLTAALSRGYGGDKVPDEALKSFDFVNVMAYDGAGYWSPDRPGQHSSFDYAKENVQYWLGRGLPRNKTVLGVPFYGYGFGDAFRKGDYPYSEIVANYPHAEDADQIGSTIWYNGIPTIAAKAKYVKEENLGGVMIWSLDADVKGEKSLLTTIDKTLRP